MIIIQEKIVSTQLFTKSFICNLSKCKGACCWEGDFGAPLEESEEDQIRQSYETIKDYLPQENRDRIEEHGVAKFYTGMNARGTQLMPDNACVFMNKNDNGIAYCGIEKAHQDGKSTLQKPISCHLYPIRVSKNEKTNFEALNYDEWDICSAACQLGEEQQMPVYQFLKEAIIRKYGESFFEELEAAAKYIDKHSSSSFPQP